MLRARSETPTFPPLCQPVENYRYFKSKSWLNKLNSCRLLGPTPLLSSESDVWSDLVATSFELYFHPTVVDSLYFRLHWLYSFLVCGVQFMCYPTHLGFLWFHWPNTNKNPLWHFRLQSLDGLFPNLQI